MVKRKPSGGSINECCDNERDHHGSTADGRSSRSPVERDKDQALAGMTVADLTVGTKVTIREEERRR
jgi:hypothetical protein